MPAEDIVYTKKDHIARITLNRPESRNAFTGNMMSDVADLIEDTRLDDDVRVLIITGNGTAFCAGADVKGLATGSLQHSTPAETRNNWRNSTHKIPRALHSLDKPCIAAINGHAVGWGMDLASMCDIRIAADTAKVCMGYVRMGVAPGGGGCYYLPKIIGMAKALELIWTGRWMDAAEMIQTGYVSKVVPYAELSAASEAFAQDLAKGPPIGIQYAKRLAYRCQDVDLNTALEMNEMVKVINWTTEDAMEGPMAFAEKRAPQFKGR